MDVMYSDYGGRTTFFFNGDRLADLLAAPVHITCPNCKTAVFSQMPKCPKCGTAIDWPKPETPEKKK